jgi:hypothetical protein
LCFLPARRRIDAAGGEAIADVLRDRQVRKQSVILEHDADGALVGRQHIDDLVANDDPPLGLSNKAGHDA